MFIIIIENAENDEIHRALVKMKMKFLLSWEFREMERFWNWENLSKFENIEEGVMYRSKN